MEVVLAKPQSDKKSDGTYSHISGSHPNHLLHGGYGGYGGNPYGSLGGYGVTAGFHQVHISSFLLFKALMKKLYRGQNSSAASPLGVSPKVKRNDRRFWSFLFSSTLI